MTNVEVEFLAAIYLLYGHECVHWLTDDEVAYSRRLGGGWRAWKHDPASFTLLKRRPAVANLLPLRAGFLRTDAETPEANLRRVSRELSRVSRWLTVSACAEAMLMLVALPAAIASQVLHYAWLQLLISFLLVHTSTAWWFLRSFREWRPAGPKGLSAMLAVALNPMAAIRSGDALAQAIFEACVRAGA